MRTIKILITGRVIIAASFILIFGGVQAQPTKEENHCFTCHTNARKLIQITREIAKTNKNTPGASSETKGEG